MGRTGAGKTTMADLLLRFVEPDRGSIEFDGIDLQHLRRDSLRDLIAIVTQESFVFDTTILENIRYGRRRAPTGSSCRVQRGGPPPLWLRSGSR